MSTHPNPDNVVNLGEIDSDKFASGQQETPPPEEPVEGNTGLSSGAVPAPKPAKKARLVADNPKVKNPGVSLELRKFLNDPQWRSVNPLQRQMTRLDARLDECIGMKIELFVVCGPPGIAKSKRIEHRLAIYNHEEETKYWATPIHERPERRTMLIEDTEKETFRPMYNRITGRISHPQMHCRMYWSSYRKELFFLDDVSSLRDKRIQELLQMASDPAAHRMVQYNYKAVNLPDDRVPPKYPMRGAIIAVTNFNREKDGDEMKELFTQPVLDRAVQLHFSFAPRPLLQYVVRNAFVRSNQHPNDWKYQTHGLLAFMHAPTAEKADEDQEADDAGCGFEGSVDEAWKILTEIKDYFLINYERSLVSFRTLRKITRDRVLHPKDWTDYAEDHLNPRPPAEKKDDGKDSPAFVERPDTSRR